jgi:hypothetical protein
MAIYAACSPARWVIATAVLCYFQGSSPFIVVGGGRISGIAPAYAMLMVGFVHYLFLRRKRIESEEISYIHMWLWAFTAIGVVGAFLLPRLFDGTVLAMPLRGSLDSGKAYPVSPSSGNAIQSIYLLLNLAIFTLVSKFLSVGAVTPKEAINGIKVGAALSCAAGAYQVVAYYTGSYWPVEFFNSNIGVGQFPDQVVFGIKRISATFWEPSVLSFHFIGSIAMMLFGGAGVAIGILLLLVQIMSTSSVGYLSLILICLLAPYFSTLPQKSKIKLLSGVLVIIVGFVLADLLFTSGTVTQKLLIEKGESSSGVNRSLANHLAAQTLLDSSFVGVGVGSTRASSLLFTMLATTGLPGLLCFSGFFYTLIRSSWKEGGVNGKALAFGLIGFAIVWVISIPDIAMAVFWFVGGLAAGNVALSRRNQLARH